MSLRLEAEVENVRAERAACLSKRKEDMSGGQRPSRGEDEGKRDLTDHSTCSLV